MIGLVYWHQHGTYLPIFCESGSVEVYYPLDQPEGRRVYRRHMGQLSGCKLILQQVVKIWNTHPELGLMSDEIRWYLNRSSKHLFCWHRPRGQYLIDIDYQQLGLAYSKYAKGLKLVGIHGIMAIYRAKMSASQIRCGDHNPEVLRQQWLLDRPKIEEIIDRFQEECGFIELPYNHNRRIKSARSAILAD